MRTNAYADTNNGLKDTRSTINFDTTAVKCYNVWRRGCRCSTSNCIKQAVICKHL